MNAQSNALRSAHEAYMSSMKDLKQADQTVARQQQVIRELNSLAQDIERSEKTIRELQSELAEVNSKYQGERSTRQDVEYLTALLGCAKRKLAWEKQIASLQKRTPELLDTVTRLLGDPKNPPTEDVRAALLQALQGIQSTMERLQSVKAT